MQLTLALYRYLATSNIVLYTKRFSCLLYVGTLNRLFLISSEDTTTASTWGASNLATVDLPTPGKPQIISTIDNNYFTSLNCRILTQLIEPVILTRLTYKYFKFQTV
jgi:hypothetical protein